MVDEGAVKVEKVDKDEGKLNVNSLNFYFRKFYKIRLCTKENYCYLFIKKLTVYKKHFVINLK